MESGIAGVFWLHGRVVLSFYRLFDVASHISSFHRLTKEEKPLLSIPREIAHLNRSN